MRKSEMKALAHFQNGPAERPHGIGPVKLFNLVQHGWIKRTERHEDFGPEFYALTESGEQALVAALNDPRISN